MIILLKKFIAFSFQRIFRIKLFEKYFYWFHKHLFSTTNIFKDLKLSSIYRNNIKLILNIDDWIDQHLYFLNKYEEPEIRYLESILRLNDNVIDIGANIGLYSLVSSRLIGKGKVFAFEPFHKNHIRLENHVILNDFRNVEIEKTAVSRNTGQMTLFLDENENNYGIASGFYNKDSTIIETVPCTSIDIYLSTRNIDNIRFIKIDIEGGEFDALLGLKSTLESFKPILLIEINDTTPYEKGELINFLNSFGYIRYYLNKNGKLISKRLPDDQSNNNVFIIQD